MLPNVNKETDPWETIDTQSHDRLTDYDSTTQFRVTAECLRLFVDIHCKHQDNDVVTNVLKNVCWAFSELFHKGAGNRRPLSSRGNQNQGQNLFEFGGFFWFFFSISAQIAKIYKNIQAYFWASTNHSEVYQFNMVNCSDWTTFVFTSIGFFQRERNYVKKTVKFEFLIYSPQRKKRNEKFAYANSNKSRTK